jgi:excisionase family DNA binding protein
MAGVKQLYFSTTEVGAILGVHRDTVYAWIVDGLTIGGEYRRLWARRVGFTYRVRQEAMDAWIDWCDRGGPAPPDQTPSVAKQAAAARRDQAAALKACRGGKAR